jgi:hypothetical protein
MPLYSKKTVLYAKIESSSGTDAAPSTANAVHAYDVSVDIKPNMLERGPGHADRSLYAQVRGKTTVDLKFWTELKGSGTAGTPPRWSPLLEACDRNEVDGASSDDYVMATTSETCTIWVNIDGILHKIVGCAGNAEIELVAGEIGKINWTFSGVYALATDVAVPVGTYDEVAPTVVKATTMNLGGYSAIAEKISIKFGNKVVERTSMNATEGVLAFMVGARGPTGTMTCEAILRATESADFMNYFHLSTTKALTFTLGATAGNIVRITAPVCVLSAPKWLDKDGIRQFEIEFQMARSAGNDEMDIYLT